ncbi:MAG: DUF935 family protein, partial [Verrucomicrobiae bacterium]|nr:DUF935 family protein [Verrucomicrobiae bacterium]
TGHQRSARGLSPEMRLDPARIVVREVERHVDWIALFCHIRKSLSQKDWDAFVEGYGLNPTTVIGPPGVPRDREGEYVSAAQGVAEHGSGYLPNGADIRYANREKGQSPFKEHGDKQEANIVLAGTGGKLTMLNGPTGLGSGQSDAHAATFASLAAAEAMDISELLNEQFDRGVIAAAHPGEPVLAYFELAAREETNPTEIISEVAGLASAGYRVPAAVVSERTGYDVTDAPAPVPSPVGLGLPPLLANALRNSARRAALAGDRATLEMINTARRQLLEAEAEELAPLRERLNALEAIRDQGEWRKAAEHLVAEIGNRHSDLRRHLGRTAASADVLANAIGAGLVNGLTARPDEPLANSRDYDRDSLGRFASDGGPLSESDNLERGGNAVERALRNKTSVSNAMNIRGLGQVDFVWGTPGDKSKEYAGGKGISHIYAKHGEQAVRELPRTLAKGRVRHDPDDPNKRIVEHGRHLAVMVKEKQKTSWTLTHYERPGGRK